MSIAEVDVNRNGLLVVAESERTGQKHDGFLTPTEHEEPSARPSKQCGTIKRTVEQRRNNLSQGLAVNRDHAPRLIQPDQVLHAIVPSLLLVGPEPPGDARMRVDTKSLSEVRRDESSTKINDSGKP
ncbi:hypothetical protein AB0E67_35095 [Streptomyces sp. NPDC032161]|uniref:hypothetical protein n=1 Tax=unclassified Streptomyces TaxID=2593676 RepID=UPI0033CF46C9